jgi:hypothetical protein
VTKLSNRLLLIEEISHDLAKVFMIANVFRRSTTRNYQSDVIRGIHVFESEIGIPRIAGLPEIVDHETQLLLLVPRF